MLHCPPYRSAAQGMPVARRIRFAALAAALSVVAILALAPDRAAAALPIAVNDTADRPDRSIGNGVCATAANTCTLRAAIQESNALLGQDTITLPPGTYELENPSVNEDSQTTGDHDITDSVTIVGAGAGATIVDGGFPLQGAQIEARGIDRLRRRSQQPQQRHRLDRGQPGGRQPRPDDPRSAPAHRPARPRADRVRARPRRIRAG